MVNFTDEVKSLQKT